MDDEVKDALPYWEVQAASLPHQGRPAVLVEDYSIACVSRALVGALHSCAMEGWAAPSDLLLSLPLSLSPESSFSLSFFFFFHAFFLFEFSLLSLWLWHLEYDMIHR